MNYELAIMALEGLSREPMRITASREGVVIEGSAAAFRELARLCLLLGGKEADAGEEFELKEGTHLAEGSPATRLRLTGSVQ